MTMRRPVKRTQPQQRSTFYRNLEERLVSFEYVGPSRLRVSALMKANRRQLSIEGRPAVRQRLPLVDTRVSAAGYFEVLGLGSFEKASRMPIRDRREAAM